jgi:hypothetical protein
MNKNVLSDALQSLVDHGIARSSGEKLLVSANAWKYLNKHFANAVPEPVPPAYEIEVDFRGEQ